MAAVVKNEMKKDKDIGKKKERKTKQQQQVYFKGLILKDLLWQWNVVRPSY